MRFSKKVLLSIGIVMTLAGCGQNAQLPQASGYGANPVLPAPEASFIPLYHRPSSKEWPEGATPAVAPGLTVKAFAKNLDHPRWLYVLPNGDVLVAESNQGTKWADTMGYGGWVESFAQRISGFFVKSPNRIMLLRDTRHSGVADTRTVFLSGLNVPIGMALVGDTLYVADTDALMAFPYKEGETQISEPGQRVVDLPCGDVNHHWTKNVIASPDGSKLYVTVGSNSNVAENGLEAEEGRAAIWEIDPKTGTHRIFASGLRNPNGMGWSDGGVLWTAVNERDQLGGDLVPDYMTSVKDGAFYGWPFSYYGQHVDDRVKPMNANMVKKAMPPDFALGAHTASLGLAFSHGANLGPNFASGVFIGQHGSWNRNPFSGYRVAFVPFAGEKPLGPPVDVLTGFLTADGVAHGRPVGVAIDKTGGLLVADDLGNDVWRVSK